MKDKQEIRKDLREIRYYYSFVKDKCLGIKEGIQPYVLELIEKYNNAIESAPIKLYETYCRLYIEGNTFESLAESMGYSIQKIGVRNKALVSYFEKELN